MAGKKQIPKTVRFEVFKRDHFTCQYCGAKAPAAILHVDHIRPRARGGVDEIINLVTACEACNLGKGARELSDQEKLGKQLAEIERMADSRETLEMLGQWRDELIERQDREIEQLYDMAIAYGRFNLYGYKEARFRATLVSLYVRFGFDIVHRAVALGVERYFGNGDEFIEKVGGISFNLSRAAHTP